MLTRYETLRVLRENLPILRADYGVCRLSIFGSIAQDAATEESDIDIIAEFEAPIGLRFVDFVERLESILGAKTDVLTPAGIAGIRNPRIIESIRASTVDV